jgi:hypothetical protein
VNKARPRLLAVSAAAAALAIAGCGGGGGDSSSSVPVTTEETTAALTKPELITQGDAICAEINAAVGTVGASEAEGSSQVTQEADLYGGLVEKLKGLGEPQESEGYAEFIASAEELAQAENDAKLASERGEESALTEAEENAASALGSFQEAAGEYGFEKCSEAPSAPVAPTGGSTEESAGGVEVEPEEEAAEPVEEVAPEEEAPEEVAPETGGAGGTAEGGGTGAGGGAETGGGSGGIGPG